MNRWILLLIQPAVLSCHWQRRPWQQRAPRPWRFPLTLLGIAAIIGGISLFNMRSEQPPRVAVSASPNDAGAFAERYTEVWPGVYEFGFETEQPSMAKRWVVTMARRSVLITLGSVLVISGWLLVLRHRYSASVFRPLTVLGLAAAGFALYAFFHAPPRHVVNRTQRMKVARASDEPARQIKDLKRAKRPSSRLQASAVKNLDELPPRAGEIPVSAELAQAAAPPAVAPDVPTDPAATPAAEKTAPADSNAPANPPAAQDPPAVVPAPAPQAAPLEVAPAVVVPSEIPLAPATTPAPGAAGERPAWLEISGQKDGSIYRTSVKSGLYAEIPECEHALEEAIQREVDHYIDKLVGEDGAAQLVNVPRSYLLEHVKKAEYTEIQTRSVGPMHQIHALLEIDNNAKEEFKRRWRDAVVSDRLWYVGSGGAVVLAMLATFWGYLKLDLHTGGLQSGRLQLAAALVALIVAAGAVLFRWAVPF